jgi:hypothetical protein
VAAISVPAEGPNSKPTLQLFTSDGTPAGYAKFGWNESTARQVRNEVEAVNRMAARVSTLQIPAVAWSSCWRGFDVAVIEPMAKEARTWHGYVPPPLSVTEEIGQAGETRTCALGDSALVKELLASTEEQPAGTEPALQALFRSAVDGVIARRGEVVLRNGAWHGDWVPWNLATAAGRTIAWDWEHSSSSAPLGFDLLHWHFQIAFIARKQSLVDALDNAKNGGAEDVVTIQGSPAALEACVDLYALELTSRYLRMHAAGAGWHPRFYPAITQVLTDLGAGG